MTSAESWTENEKTGNSRRCIKTYENGPSLSDSRRHEPQPDSAHGKPKPISRGAHAGWKRRRVPDVSHELDHPAAQRDLGPRIHQQEEAADPGDPVAQRFSGVSARLTGCFLVICSVLSTRLGPKRRPSCSQLGNGKPDHEIIERIPLQTALCNHRRCKQRAQRRSKPVECM